MNFSPSAFLPSRTFEAIGAEAFVPASEVEEGGIYTVQRLDRPGWGLEGGLRYDRRSVTATPLSGGSEVERDFGNWSGSAAAFIKPSPSLFLGLSLAHNERAPSEAVEQRERVQREVRDNDTVA